VRMRMHLPAPSEQDCEGEFGVGCRYSKSSSFLVHFELFALQRPSLWLCVVD
jgi:hypothetical protein